MVLGGLGSLTLEETGVPGEALGEGRRVQATDLSLPRLRELEIAPHVDVWAEGELVSGVAPGVCHHLLG